MKAGYKFVALASVLLTLAFGLLHSASSVSAASPGHRILVPSNSTAQLHTTTDRHVQRPELRRGSQGQAGYRRKRGRRRERRAGERGRLC